MKFILSLTLALSICIVLMGFTKRKKKSLQTDISGQYELVSYLNEKMISIPDPSKTKITLDTKSNLLTCHVGCNSISGKLVVKGKQIAPLRLISTEMYCNDVANLEQKIIEHLNQVNQFTQKKEFLNLCHDQEILLMLKRKK